MKYSVQNRIEDFLTKIILLPLICILDTEKCHRLQKIQSCHLAPLFKERSAWAVSGSAFLLCVTCSVENPEFWKQYTGIQVLQTLARIKGEIHKEEIVESMKRVGLLDKKDIVVGKYSLGMRQRLGIAQAIMEKPEILLFDEPTNALDREGVSLFLEIIKEEKKRGALIVIVSHDPNTLLDICDEIITMENGKVIEQGEAVNEKN